MAEISKYKEWLEKNPDKKGTDDYRAVEAQYRAMGGLSDEIQALKDYVNDPKTTTVERLGAAVAYPIIKGKEMLVSAGVKGAPAVVGGMVGQKVGGPVGARVGAASGALVGSIVDQKRRGEDVRLGETMADVGSALINPRGAISSVATSGALSSLSQVIDTGKVDPKAVAGAMSIGGAGAMAARSLRPKPILDAKSSEYLYRIQALKNIPESYGVKINPAELERGLDAWHEFAGKSSMSVMASRQNQQAWQRLVRDQVGLPASKKDIDGGALAFRPARRKFGLSLEDGEIDEAVKKAAEPYRKLEEISRAVNDEVKLIAEQKLKNGKYVTSFTTPEGIDAMRSAEANWKQIQELRRQKSAEYHKLDAGDPQAFARIQALKDLEASLEIKIEQAAVATGIDGLKDQLVDARRKIAILKAADNATTTYGLVDPKKLSTMYRAGEPLNGNLEAIAVFYDAFPASASERASLTSAVVPGVSANFAARNMAQGNSEGWLSGGFPFASKGARQFIMRDSAQQKLREPITVLPPMDAKERSARMLSQIMSQQGDNDIRPVPYR